MYNVLLHLTCPVEYCDRVVRLTDRDFLYTSVISAARTFSPTLYTCIGISNTEKSKSIVTSHKESKC